MDKTITVQGKTIRMEMTQHKVKLANDDQLAALLANNTEAATDMLVKAIKQEFRAIHNKDIDISDASMAVEIWGHVYTENFATAIKSLSSVGFINSIADKVISKCDVIDMGESGRDNNRFVWDTLSKLKSQIAALLPK